MPPQPYVPRWIKLTAKFSHEGSTMLFNMNLLGPVGRPTEAQLITLCTAWYTTVWPALQALMSVGYTLTLVEATDRYDVLGAYGSYTPPVLPTGSKSGESLPANVACVISLKTGLSGRTAHGRLYTFGYIEADTSGSFFNSANVVLASNLASAMLSFAGGVGIATDWCVLSLKDEALRPINGYSVDNVVDSQRRRLPGRGY